MLGLVITAGGLHALRHSLCFLAAPRDAADKRSRSIRQQSKMPSTCIDSTPSSMSGRPFLNEVTRNRRLGRDFSIMSIIVSFGHGCSGHRMHPGTGFIML